MNDYWGKLDNQNQKSEKQREETPYFQRFQEFMAGCTVLLANLTGLHVFWLAKIIS